MLSITIKYTDGLNENQAMQAAFEVLKYITSSQEQGLTTIVMVGNFECRTEVVNGGFKVVVDLPSWKNTSRTTSYDIYDL